MLERAWFAGLILLVSCGEPGAPVSKDLLVWRTDALRGNATPAVDATHVFHLDGSTVFAVDRSSGTLAWTRALPTTRPTSGSPGLALSSGRLVVGKGEVFGLNPTTGEIVWTFTPSVGSAPGFNSVFAQGNTVYIGSTTGHIYALDAATGAQLWVTQFNPAITYVFHLSVANGTVYAGFTDHGGSVARGGAVAIDAPTGALKWKTFAPQSTPSQSTENVSGIAVGPSYAVMGTTRGAYGLDLQTGEVKKTLRPDMFWSTDATVHEPRQAGNLVLVGTQMATLTALDATTLDVVWQRFPPSGVTSLTTDATYAFAAVSGLLLKYRLSDGRLMWAFDPRDLGMANELFLAAPEVESAFIYLPGIRSIYALRKE